MYLIVGLGNPGPRYALTRHNIGFLAVDVFAESFQVKQWQTSSQYHLAQFQADGEKIFILKPMTFMNLSGEAVKSVANFYKIPIQNILVSHDEIDLPYEGLRFHKNRGPGGHNGVKSINEHLGTQDYARLKLGVGRPTNPEMNVADFVLQKFNPEENMHLVDFLNRAGDAIESFIFDGLEKASNKFNSQKQGSI